MEAAQGRHGGAGRDASRAQVADAVLGSVDVPIVACDAAGHLTIFNRASRELHGLDADASVEPADLPRAFGLYDIDGITPLDGASVPLIRALTEGHVAGVQIVIAPVGRSARTVTCTGRRLFDEHGRLSGAVVWMHDITDHLVAERALVDSEQMFRMAFVDSTFGFALADEDGRLLEVNAALCRLLGRTPGWLLEHGLSDGPQQFQPGRRPGAHGEAVQERLLSRGDGGTRWVRIVRSDVATVAGQRVLLQLEDVTARRVADQELRSAALLDPLTGLPNRALLADRTQAALDALSSTGRSLALMFLDLDGFKSVNDEYGHELGDALLVEAAHRLTNTVRSQDTVARLGGDEFVLLCCGLDRYDHAEGRGIIDRVLAALRRPYQLGSHEVLLSASLGVVFADDGEQAPAALLAAADAAMYEAKRTGKARYATSSASTTSTARLTRRTEHLLRRALDDDAVVLHYQPVLDLHSGAVVGAEALARIPDGRGGLLPPGEFVPIAEATGLVGRLGMAVLDQAVRQAVAWKRHLGDEREFGLGVNLSVRQLGEPGLVARVDAVLTASGLPRDALLLELTESVFSDSDEHAMVLRELAALGPKIVIDDFGTGYSSLSYLRRFPVDCIKIDRSFVTDLAHDERDRTVTRALVRMAQDLGLPVIAEGIEHAGQLAVLQRIGCPLGQGFLLSRPLPPDDIWPLLDRPLPLLAGHLAASG